MRSVNGNTQNINHINLMQYNKGSSNYATKEHFLNQIITDNKIDIAYISEANLSQSYISNSNIITGYSCETKPMTDNIDISQISQNVLFTSS